ncbi:MAG TPA: AsmA family protein, partial [Acetobacteraceae bacterium]|nr:AsmA family protein [Acetobacteraceae bacterium]
MATDEIREIEEFREREPRPGLWLGLAGAVVVVGLVIGFLFWTLNSGSLKPRLIEAVQRATGRTLTISGQTRFELSLSPTVSMENVALANPPGFSRANMITVARVEVGLDLLPLLEHRLEVDHVTLVQPDVVLETDASGRHNWLFSRENPPQASGTAPAAPVQTAADAPADSEARQRLAVWFANASVTDGRVGWLDAKSGQHHEAQVPQLTLNAPPGDAAQLTGAVVYLGRTITLTGRAEPTELADSGPGSGPWPVSLKLATGDADLTVDGQIEHPAEARGYSLTIDAAAPDPSIFAPWLPGLPLASLKSLTAHAEVSDSGGTAPTLSTARIKVASVDVGMLGDGAKLENVTIGAKGDAPISVAAAVTRDGFESGITGTIGDLRWLNAGGTGPVAVDLEWNAAAARAFVKGTVKAPAQMTGFDLDVAADVPKPVQIM